MKKVENSEKLAAWCGLVYGFRRFYVGSRNIPNLHPSGSLRSMCFTLSGANVAAQPFISSALLQASGCRDIYKFINYYIFWLLFSIPLASIQP